MTGPLSQFFIGGWGSTDAVWRGTLMQASTAEPHFLGWLIACRIGRECSRRYPQYLDDVFWSDGLSAVCSRSGRLWNCRKRCRHGVGLRHAVHVCAGQNHGGIDPRTLAAMRVRVARNPAPVLDDFAQQCALPDGDGETCASYLRQAKQFSAAELAAGLECLATLDLRERLGKINVPCKILHGECDQIVPLTAALSFLPRSFRLRNWMSWRDTAMLCLSRLQPKSRNVFRVSIS